MITPQTFIQKDLVCLLKVYNSLNKPKNQPKQSRKNKIIKHIV
jgi:hypothetical protein